ncbi:virulence factor SrfC family protein [Flavobacterium sp.]|uniref:virulence factor SrfC family protein n=1 Tax=Flavobacterium sp. TaxID=239 RepID=UPI002486E2CB|nr:virulence factor SrfC family protein [Flavobacterium sp.]MDI1317436.1 virulence factor SrfC family protein [Flavobacterium sp.]
MKHYSEQDIAVLKEDINSNSIKLTESVKWVESNLKYEEKHSLLLKLKNALNTFRKVYNNIDSKPVIAIFGGSQVGKSYLIKNLLSSKGQPFVIKNNNKEYDFLKDINPPGVGAESTGVVTRFTINNEVKYEEFPIKVKLLSPKDILIIILDSFFLDLKKITNFDKNKELDIHIKNFESNYSNSKQTILSEYDILEIKEYFENHLSKHTILFEGLNESRFFERIGKIIDGFEYQEWKAIFEVLWNKNDHFSALFSKLISDLKTVNFDAVAYLSFKEVLRGEGEVLDVKRLKELYTCNKFTTIKKENGEEIKINLSLITALTAELVFSIPNELTDSKEFLKNSDLLDFPGARSRLAIEIEDVDDEIIPDMLLRGKVSYLFNKYSDDFNINNLLFCTNDKQLDVNEIPSLLFNWISKNIGGNAYDRNNALKDANVPPLFIIFTFFNNQLKFDTTNDFEYANDVQKLDYKWDTRFNRFFENEIVTQTKDWHIDWTKDQQNFKNFYLLRDFKYSTDSFDGFEEKGYEIKVREERSPFLDKLKESFLNFKFVQNHFDSPANSWNIAANLNNDGSELIIDNLTQVSNNLTKTNHYINKLNNLVIDLKRELNKHIHTDDLTILRANSMKSVNEIQFSFNAILTKDINGFNQLIKRVSVEPVEIYNLLNENIVVNINEKSLDNFNQGNILMSQYPELRNVNSYEEVIEILKQNLWLSSNQEVESFLSEKGIKKENLFTNKETKSKAQFYTELLLNYWESKITNQSNLEYFINNGLSQNSTSFLANHLSKIIENRGLKDKLERILNDVVSETNTNRGVEEFLAETFSLLINEIVINFDINYFTTEELIEIDNLKSNSNFKFYNKTIPTDQKTIQGLFENNSDEVSNSNRIVLDKYNKWIEFFRISLLVNCGFVSYDEQANNQLKELINDFNEFKLN